MLEDLEKLDYMYSEPHGWSRDRVLRISADN